LVHFDEGPGTVFLGVLSKLSSFISELLNLFVHVSDIEDLVTDEASPEFDCILKAVDGVKDIFWAEVGNFSEILIHVHLLFVLVVSHVSGVVNVLNEIRYLSCLRNASKSK
jgi:hypothetical protein